MNLSDLGNLGEFIGAFGVIGSLIYVGYQIRQNTIATERTNARLTAADHSRALFGLLDEKVSDIILRGTADMSSLTEQERYRFDIGITGWLETIEQGFADYRQGNFPEEIILQYRTRIAAVLGAPGGVGWWQSRRIWFSESFRKEVDTVLANIATEATQNSIQISPSNAPPPNKSLEPDA